MATSSATAPAHRPEQDDGTNRSQVSASTLKTITVMRLDSLWAIAERELGDGERWAEIAALNEGRTMSDGGAFTSADLIRPGWELLLPHTQAASSDFAATNDGTVRVEPGDTLSSVAAATLGDADAYPSIFRASRDIEQPDGAHLTDPDVIDTGWTLRIPARAERGNGGDGGGAAATNEQVPQPEPTPGLSLDGPSTQAPSRSDTPGATPDPTSAPTSSPEADATSNSTPDQDEQSSEAERGSDGVDNPGASEDAVTEQGPPPWMLASLSGGGAVLGGALFLALRSRRRAQARWRTPGHTFIPLSPGLIDAEKSARAHASSAATSSAMDVALRQMAAWSATNGTSMPHVAAAELTSGRISLHLSAPTSSMPPTWTDATGSGLVWTTDLSAESEADRGAGDHPAALGAVDPPYPALVTVGQASTGETWLLNLEEIGVLSVRGDPTTSANLVRYILAELALNPWSAQARVSCLDVGHDVVALNADRLSWHQASEAAVVVDDLVAAATVTLDRSRQLGGTPASGRTGRLDDDLWPSSVVVASHLVATDELAAVIAANPAITGVCLVQVHDGDLIGGTAGSPVVALIDVDGSLQVPAFGLHLSAVQMTDVEATGCGALLKGAESVRQRAMPVDPDAGAGWQAFVDRSGAVRGEQTTPRASETDDTVASRSLLPRPTADYVATAPVTAEDVDLLAPVVSRHVTARLDAADPSLEQDYSDWFDVACRRPRVSLLGPVEARTCGTALARRKPYFTEMLSFLVLRRQHGVTPAELAETFRIEVRKARIYINTIRDWLGRDPVSDGLYLPHADKAPSARLTGIPVYQVSGRVLVDTELFTRLRAHGQADGEAGIQRLQMALQLVRGEPFSGLRPGGWSWLLDGEREDQYIVQAVADVALIATTRALGEGDADMALVSSAIGLQAAPHEEAVQLARVRALEAAGRITEAVERLRASVSERIDDDDLAPETGPARTNDVLASFKFARRSRLTEH